MTIALGIDTGGTYTDAVLVDQENGSVLASAKALTTYHDLSVGITSAVSAVLQCSSSGDDLGATRPEDVGLVGLSTTLATNAIVEGNGSPVCLILIGYDPALIEQYGFGHDLVTDDVVYIQGGHDSEGNQVAPLDESSVRDAILARQGLVSAFAVSGYFGVRNRAHELRVRELIEEMTASWNGQTGMALPVTCAHELTTRLNSVRRATTAALNARLIPLLHDLIATVRCTLDELGITAPLMIVKGDGSLVRSEWAMRRPIETILSGPAASVVGTWHLAGERDVWVVDVGGTTTDIAVLRDGRPRVNPEGAVVGGWRTMVEAADVHTVGLGGDSHVRLDGNRMPGSEGLTVGPQRVVPLSLLAVQYPQVVDELRRQVEARERMRISGQFALVHRPPDTDLSQSDRGLLDILESEPRSLIWMADSLLHGPLVVRQLDDLITRQLVRRSAFTPTDALHVLGLYKEWDVDAARLGAELLAEQMGLTPEEVCQRVVAEMSNRVTTELVTKALIDESVCPDWQREPAAAALLARAIGSMSAPDLDCQISLRRSVIAVGAPVAAYLPRTAEQLRTELIIPTHADVANAVGAVAGSVVQRIRALIRPIEAESFFRLYLPDGVHDFAHLEQAVAHAEQMAPDQVESMARSAGAEQVEVKHVRVDRTSPVQVEWGQDIYLETELTFTAVGRPSLVR
jgi:N-methylhydantoinase A/oxoprolinase/acetone carboxylase beta subunit